MDQLSESIEIKVRFNESDPLGVVWHGHYVNYFEDGRAAFGLKYDFSYLDVYKHGYAVPIVKLNCDYKKPLYYGNTAIVKTTLLNQTGAKICFEYEVYNAANMELVAEGSTIQVFIVKETFELQLISPSFFAEWKKKWLLT